ncbi:MAG: EVE domain-containing protein [Gammaproteobacteria bacterium]|nr:EVE domain-containing protein [Gammaproteobacteria bacterium]MBT5117382.1 EVE domain-containing protein [Gammaproteobacteria bacterium]MBT5643511.1 EVE domain-containing protein [Gammaproteobacteria bacterium]MBT5863106.1 EVE domain-containing protein [Gammaproteobacteria bacterium]MBT6734155.1 EVE domain-containing protein [Gammaproteobacteria bacterium]|tara:strand:+ start:6055 stop:6510 length:456 start_codon:yes stop_codon:yes gene_type:complete
MKYWLMKNEPDDYSIDDLKKDKTEPWDGIRNYQVRNMIRDDMSIGDIAFYYHSNCDIPGIYGLMTINSKAYPDHTAFDKKAKYYDIKSDKKKPTWLMVDVKYKRKLKNPITLKELKSEKKLSNMKVVQKGNRLSITEVEKKDWEYILSLEK